MKKLEFKEIDFCGITAKPWSNVYQHAAEIAQAKFDEWFKQIENAPVVYGICEDLNIPRLASLEWAFLQSPKDTHTARLVDIQEIKKEPCKHEPEVHYINNRRVWKEVCKHCGVELVAEWREK